MNDVPVIRGANDDPDLSDDELIEQRKAWFEGYVSAHNVYAPPEAGPYTCPCCGHLTLSERGGYDICSECNWEDDGQDNHDSVEVRGGPNYHLSLDAARAEYIAKGGKLQPHRPPS